MLLSPPWQPWDTAIFQPALQVIPAAASVDGSWQRFRFVTLPLLSPTILFLTVFIAAFINYLKRWRPGVAPGGPGGTQIVLYLRADLLFPNVSRVWVNVMSWMLAILIFIVTMAQFRFARSTVFCPWTTLD